MVLRDWFKKNWMKYSLTFVFVVHIMQLPHMFWAADAYLELGVVARQSPMLDFILYGVDLLEIPSIIQVGILWIYHVKRNKGM